MIECKNLTKQYAGMTIIKDLSICINDGEFVFRVKVELEKLPYSICLAYWKNRLQEKSYLTGNRLEKIVRNYAFFEKRSDLSSRILRW